MILTIAMAENGNDDDAPDINLGAPVVDDGKGCCYCMGPNCPFCYPCCERYPGSPSDSLPYPCCCFDDDCCHNCCTRCHPCPGRDMVATDTIIVFFFCFPCIAIASCIRKCCGK